MSTSLEAAIQASAQRLARDLVRHLRAAGVQELVELAGTHPAVQVQLGGGDPPRPKGAQVKQTAPARGGAATAKQRVNRAIKEEAAAHKLTEREFEILTLSVHGMPRKALAEECGVAPQTMKMNVRTLLRKLKTESLTEATARIMQRAVTYP